MMIYILFNESKSNIASIDCKMFRHHPYHNSPVIVQDHLCISISLTTFLGFYYSLILPVMCQQMVSLRRLLSPARCPPHGAPLMWAFRVLMNLWCSLMEVCNSHLHCMGFSNVSCSKIFMIEDKINIILSKRPAFQ